MGVYLSGGPGGGGSGASYLPRLHVHKNQPRLSISFQC